MEGFYCRYRVSSKILRLWVLARQLDIAMVASQHSAQAIGHLLDCLENLVRGIDLLDNRACKLPTATIDRSRALSHWHSTGFSNHSMIYSRISLKPLRSKR